MDGWTAGWTSLLQVLLRPGPRSGNESDIFARARRSECVLVPCRGCVEHTYRAVGVLSETEGRAIVRWRSVFGSFDYLQLLDLDVHVMRT